MEQYFSFIKKSLNNDVQNIELVSNSSNVVFKVKTEKYGTVYAKFYLNKSSHIDHEMNLYGLMDNSYLKEMICSSDNPKFAIFKELRGLTIDELSEQQLQNNKDKIIDSLIYFYETVGKNKAEGYGLLDQNMKGTSNNFKEFIYKRQMDTQSILKDYPILNSAFSKIYDKYNNLITPDNCLVPIDTNAKNIMVTEKSEVKFIDPGELISAPKLMGYGDFVAHTYKTELYETLMSKLKLNKDDEKRLRIYAVFSSLNVLAFLKKLGVNDLKDVVPYGNSHSFYELINEHLNSLDIEPINKSNPDDMEL